VFEPTELAEPAVTGSGRHTTAVYWGHVLLLAQTINKFDRSIINQSISKNQQIQMINVC
jgi:hypothetical protein